MNTSQTKNMTPSTILMCKPEFFDVQYIINPWMEGNISRAKTETALKQWEKLQSIIASFTMVELIEPVKNVPDLVFTANAGLVFDKTCIISRFFFEERSPEEPLFEKWFNDRGFECKFLPQDVPFEGAGDALFDREQPILWAGYGFRTELEAHSYLNNWVPVEVLSLRLVDNRFYHLDTCFCPLENGYLLYFPGAFDEFSNRLIELRVPEEKRIPITEEDASLFACNAVNIGTNIILNEASSELRKTLENLGFNLHCTPLSEFMKSGGAAKCLTLKLDEPLPVSTFESPTLNSQTIEFEGHIIDNGTLGSALDIIVNGGGSFHVNSFHLGEQRQSPSKAEIKILAPSKQIIDMILPQLIQLGGTLPLDEIRDVELATVNSDGVAPDDFYLSTIYATNIRHQGNWIRVQSQRMDSAIVIKSDPEGNEDPSCCLIRDLRKGDKVVVGVQGVRTIHKVKAREPRHLNDYGFMGSALSSERRIELVVEQVAWEFRQMRDRGAKITVTAGPVVVHTGGSSHLAWLAKEGYISVFLGGNAIAVHDIEQAIMGTSLGVDISRGIQVQGGHRHHLSAINTIRRHGSIKNAVEAGILKSGFMYECIKNEIPFCLAGSIHDDGPLPDTEMNIIAAQTKCASLIKGSEIILLLSSMLHSIGVGNMTPAGVKIVCVDTNPAVLAKLNDRGNSESIGLVTDVGLFLSMLVERLKKLTKPYSY